MFEGMMKIVEGKCGGKIILTVRDTVAGLPWEFKMQRPNSH